MWLLPSGSDQVGDDLVRPTPAAHMGEDLGARKFAAYIAPFIDHSPGLPDVASLEPEAA